MSHCAEKHMIEDQLRTAAESARARYEAGTGERDEFVVALNRLSDLLLRGKLPDDIHIGREQPRSVGMGRGR